jgi:hypothetical protein
MKTRFDLEQQILDCWGICDDINTVFEHFYEQGQPVDIDKLANILLGLKELYHIKFEQTFETFEHLIHTREI